MSGTLAVAVPSDCSIHEGQYKTALSKSNVKIGIFWMNISDVSVSKINGSVVSGTFKRYLIKKTQTTQPLIIWTGNLEYTESRHFYYHFVNIPIFSPLILTCRKRPVHENEPLKAPSGVIMWASGSWALERIFQWRRWKTWEWRRRQFAMLCFPRGAAWRPQVGKEATGGWGGRGTSQLDFTWLPYLYTRSKIGTFEDTNR